MLRDPLTLDQARAWASWIAISGQLNLVSEWLPGLPEDRLDIVKRSMPNTGLCGRPIDLFDQPDAPRIWQLTSRPNSPTRRDLVGLFNWDPKSSTTIDCPLAQFNLPAGPNADYVAFDYWNNQFLTVHGSLHADLPASSCRVIAIRPAADHPIVISTSRHITQGVIDLVEESWDANRKQLAGTSRVVANDPYQIRIVSPAGTKVTGVELSDPDRTAAVTITVDDPTDHARVTVHSKTNREVHWTITF